MIIKKIINWLRYQIDNKIKFQARKILIKSINSEPIIQLQEKHINDNFYSFNSILINPNDPGGSGSSSELQSKAIDLVKKLDWNCSYWDNGLTLCKK